METELEKYLRVMKEMTPFNRYQRGPGGELQKKAKRLCWEYNRTSPDEQQKRHDLLKQMLGTCPEHFFIQPVFNCDYGFNIHIHGFCFINYNCTILDTSPVHIGQMAFIAPGCVLSCAGHAIHPEQRLEGLSTSAPIVLEDNVWLGANVTVCGGVTIGEGSVIGAGSVVTRSIPAGMVAAGVPCRVLRRITEADRIPEDLIQ